MSDLVEKVQRAICFKMNHSESGWVHYEYEARAAIAAVAEWIDPLRIPALLARAPHEIVAARLRNELEQPK